MNIKLSLALSAFCMLIGLSSCDKQQTKQENKVVTDKEAKIHAGPDASYTEIFVLRSGSEVKVTRSQGNWKKILVNQEEGQSQAGWLEESQIKTIL